MSTKTRLLNEPFAVAILAGGQSRRMGRDKAQIFTDGGVSWLERTTRLALEVTPDVAIVGRATPSGWPLESAGFLEDATPGLGPLGGLLAALRWAQSRGAAGVLALACDMPQLTAPALCWILEAAARRSSSHGLAVLNSGRLEPLFSIYGAACLPIIERKLDASTEPSQPKRGRFSLRALIEEAEFSSIEAPEEIAAQLRNINTPQDLESLAAECAMGKNDS